VGNWFDPANPNRETTFPRLAANPQPSPINALTNRQLENGSFLRVRNITFGYRLPRPWLDKIKVQTARVYFSAQNLFTFTRYTGYNPEVSLNADNVFAPGVDQGTYPLNRVITFGLNVAF
jgi:hypothetical protein